MNQKNLKAGKDFPKFFLYNMHQVYILVQKHIEKKMSEAKTSLTFSQYWVLVCFINCEDSVKQTASQVAKKMFITEATLSRHVDKLIKTKLIEKRQDKDNRRKFILNLTPLGVKKFNEAKKIIEKELETIFNVVQKEYRTCAVEIFETILQKLTITK